MSYLNPPPGDAPVVVIKDIGGYVDEYSRQTALYLQSNREVRLHECRSACTIALALPNVCVYPDSVLKFHKAYNPITKVANEEVSAAMMAAYPGAVRERLGNLTRNYKVLTGSELIRLGIRDCTRPDQPRVMIARAKLKENPPENPLSNAFGGLVAGLTPQSALPTATVKVASVKAETARLDRDKLDGDMPVAPEATIPTPPARPAELTAPVRDVKPGEAIAATEAPPQAARAAPRAPEPPPVPGSNLTQPIKGSAPVLFTVRFAPYPYRLASRS